MSVPEIQLLHRKAVIDTLIKAIETYPLVVLTAPMGYGKSTSAREVKRSTERHTSDIAVHSGPSNAHDLWHRACSQLAAQGSEIAYSMQASGFPSSPREIQRVLDYGRNYLGGAPALIIIDDYHYVNAPEMDALLETLVREGIPNIRLLLVSRSKPPLPLEELSLKGLATFIDKNLLAFSLEETEEFFRMHQVRDPLVARQAWEYSEGWPAAVWLSLQSYQTHGSLVPHRTVEGLLESVVFSRYSEEEKRFLLQLSLLPRFSARQAAAVTDDPHARRKLHALHEQNSFLNYEPATSTFFLHTLFKSYLTSRLEAADDPVSASIDRQALYRRIGKWYEADHDYVQAIKAYAGAGEEQDFLSILTIFEKPGDGMLVMFDPAAIKEICTSIPWPIRFQCPIGYLAFVYHYMSRIDLGEGTRLLDEAEERFLRQSDIAQELKRRIKGEIILMRGITAFNDLFAMRDTHEDSRKLLDGRSSIAHRQLIWNFGCPHSMFLYLRRPGTYAELLTLIEGNLQYFQEMADGCSMGAQDLFHAEYLLERGRLKQVEAFLMKAVYRATGKEQSSTLISANFTQARLLLATGQGAAALSLLDDTAARYSPGASPLLGNALDSGKGYIAACMGACESIPRWLRDGKTADGGSFYQGTAFPLVVYGKTLLLKKNWLRLEIFAQDLPSRFGDYAFLFGIIHAGILEAIAAYHLDGIERGAALIRKALDLARPDGIILSIAEYGKHIAPLLREHVSSNPGDAFARTLLRMARSYGQIHQAVSRTSHPADMLKEREELLLSLAAKGKSNNEISAHLNISEAAVKKAFSAIYRKLGVRGRVEAVQFFLGTGSR